MLVVGWTVDPRPLIWVMALPLHPLAPPLPTIVPVSSPGTNNATQCRCQPVYSFTQSMPSSSFTSDPDWELQSSRVWKDATESGFIGKLQGLRYQPGCARMTGRKASPKGKRGSASQYRSDIIDHFALLPPTSGSTSVANGCSILIHMCCR